MDTDKRLMHEVKLNNLKVFHAALSTFAVLLNYCRNWFTNFFNSSSIMEFKLTSLICLASYLNSCLGNIAAAQNAIFPATFDNADSNLTLDTTDDVDTYWTISRTNVKKWFEYYNNTGLLQKNISDSTCGGVLSGNIDKLADVNGIWVACQDPGLPGECYTSPTFPCHPLFSFQNNNGVGTLKTVKLRVRVEGMAIVRLGIGHGTSDCFDYGNRIDSFSPCEFHKLPDISASGWFQVRSLYDGYDNVAV